MSGNQSLLDRSGRPVTDFKEGTSSKQLDGSKVGNYLANKVDLRKRDRGRVLDLLFGEAGMATVGDTISLDQQMSLLQAKIIKLLSLEATKYINRVLINIKEFVNTPHRELNSESLWTNNACESLNNILKLIVGMRSPMHNGRPCLKMMLLAVK